MHSDLHCQPRNRSFFVVSGLSAIMPNQNIDNAALENLGRLAGIVVGTLITASICGLLPLYLGKRLGRFRLGIAGFAISFISVLGFGLLVAVPVTILLTVIVLLLGKGKSKHPTPVRSVALALLAYLSAIGLLLFGAVYFILASVTLKDSDAFNLAVVPLLLIILTSAGLLIRYGKRLKTKTYAETLANDTRDPVLYLRSFRDDAKTVTALDGRAILSLLTLGTKTEEDALVKAFSRIGPVIAIGDPNEMIPETGAARLYVGHDEWQTVAHNLMSTAKLIILYAGWTDGVSWEMRRAKRSVPPEKLLLMLPNPLTRGIYMRFRARAEDAMGICFPTAYTNARFIRFSEDWQPSFIRVASLRKFHRRNRPPTFTHIVNALLEPMPLS